MKKIISTIVLIYISLISISGQSKRSDANIIGHVVCEGEHIKFANIIILGTTIGAATDETGHYRLINLPLGELTVRVQALGYKPKEETVILEKNKTIEIKFDLEKDVLGMEQVVVTSDRNETSRIEASTIVNTLTPKLFESTQSPTFCEALNFTPGVRTENNCENCGFSQVRMNGLEGPYSQILINSRPVFSGLAGVYGLELIPTSMIEKVEVIRGGGSALYGSNAIAGTINLIIKDPIKNSYEIGSTAGLVGLGVEGSGDPAMDKTVNFNTSIVSSDSKTGLAVFGFYRDRNKFDANNDKFSEITTLNNTTIGGRLFHRFSIKDKISLDFFNINEKRRGGDNFNYPLHEANIAEALEHKITNVSVNYERFFRKQDIFSIFGAGQYVDRDSYYGANKSLSDYGKTKDFSYTIGAQYNAIFNSSKLVLGIENNGEWLKDEKLGYPDYSNISINNNEISNIIHTKNVIIADQNSNTVGTFAQYELKIKDLSIALGGRFDHYNVTDTNNEKNTNSGNVFSPRINILYDLEEYLQARISYSKGYRAPQIFDEDLHIETSGSRKVIHKNNSDLEQENSNSIMASLDFNKKISTIFIGILVEGFYTNLDNPFANEKGDADENGVVTYTRINADAGASVKGINFEASLIPNNNLSFQSGFTFQNSEYEEAQDFNEKKFLRTPESYGYFTMNWDFSKVLGTSITGNYTGEMLAPYHGPSIESPEEGELRKTKSFFDLGIKVKYNYVLNGATLQIFSGIKNICNSYQNDFDKGVDRDPAYVYGPINPRTVYMGLKIGNAIN